MAYHAHFNAVRGTAMRVLAVREWIGGRLGAWHFTAAAGLLALLLLHVALTSSLLGQTRFPGRSELKPTTAIGYPSLGATSLSTYSRIEVKPMVSEGLVLGLDPGVLRAAYDLSTSVRAGEGATIAIITAYHNPTAESDLAVFSKQFGLPECTVENGCFTQVSPQGTEMVPGIPTDWMYESALDTQWAHAIAPGAKVLLVEARTSKWDQLLAAVDYAKAHARYVTMSWGSLEFAEETTFDSHFVQSGVSFFASSGDLSGTVHYPSASPYVVSVGGTVLNTFAREFLSEFRWPHSGWGCSAYERGTPAQLSFRDYSAGGCGQSRATPDISLIAEPGLTIYWNGNWHVGRGTSVATVIVAARAAVSGTTVDADTVYGSSMSFRSVKNGADVRSAGFDLTTGRGSWVGPIVTPSRVTIATDDASPRN